MAAGGIYDHLGGGFARYSTERHWLVPHFEKMLYDNAQLAARLPARLAGHRRRRVPPGRRGDARLPAAAPDAQPAGRHPLRRGRRQRGRGGQVLRLVARRGRGGRGPAAVEWYGVTAARQLGGLQHPVPAPRSRAAPAARGRGGPGRPSSTAGSSGSGPDWTTRCSPNGTPWPSPPWPKPASPSAGADWVERGGGDRRLPAAGACAASPDGRWLRTWQGGRRRGATWPTPSTTPGWSRPSPGWPRRPARPAGSPRPATAADALLGLVLGRRRRRPVHHRARRRARSSPARRTPRTGPTPSANSVAAVALLRLAALTGEARYTDAGTGHLPPARAARGQASVAFTDLVAAADLLV